MTKMRNFDFENGSTGNTGEKTFSASFEPQPNKTYHVFSIFLKLYVPIFKVENEKRLASKMVYLPTKNLF
jgi:hypothetical protein